MNAEEIAQLFRQAVQLQRRREIAQAESIYRSIISFAPNLPQVHFNLGIVLRMSRRYEEAIAEYREALSLEPGFAEAWNNLGIVQRTTGRLDEAIAAFGAALACKADYVDALNNLGAALEDVGRVEEALQHLERAVQLQPGSAAIHSNLVYALHYHPKCDSQMLLDSARRWSDQHAAQFRSSIPAHPKDASPDRRLRHRLCLRQLPRALPGDVYDSAVFKSRSRAVRNSLLLGCRFPRCTHRAIAGDVGSLARDGPDE